METAAPEAPDISALGASPALASVPQTPEANPFKEAVRSATKELPSPDEVEQEGMEKAQPPEKIATALQRLRADASSAYQQVAESSPEHTDQAFQKRDQINEDFNKRIEAQKQAATSQWAQGHFQSEDEFKQFASTYDKDPVAAAQTNPEAAESLDKLLKHPAFQEHRAGPAMDINSPEGSKLGFMQAHPDMHGGYDIHVNLNNGEGTGSFKVKGNATKSQAYKAFSESPIGKKAGEYHPIKGALSETALGLQNVAASILDKLGLHDDAVEFRQRAREQYEKNAKTTAVSTVGTLARETEQLAGKLPIWTLPAGLPAEMWASAEAKGKNMADDVADQAFKEPDQAKSKQLQADAQKLRDNAAIYGAASAATGLAAGKLLALPLQGVLKLLPATFQKTFAEKITSLGGTVAAETANITAIELLQGQVVDPVFGFERAPLSNLINPGNILFGAVFGAKRYRSVQKTRVETERLKKLAGDVISGKINSPQQIFDAIHGKASETEPTVKVSGINDGLTAEPVMEGDIIADAKLKQRPSTAQEAAKVISDALEAKLNAMDAASRAEWKEKEAAAISRLQYLSQTPSKSAAESAAVLKAALEKRDQQGESKLSGVPMTGDTVAYNGYVGRLAKDGPRLEVHTEDGKIIEVEDNNIRLLTKVESTQPFDSYAYAGRSGWRYLKSNISPNGQLVSVTLIHPDGTKAKVKGDQAHKIAGLERARYLKTQIESSTPSEAGAPSVTSSHGKNAIVQLLKSVIGRMLRKGALIVPDWQRAIAHKELRPFSADELSRIKQSEGFYDPQTGKVVVILENVRPKNGETPEQAVIRVLIHERVGHEGARWMLDNDPQFRKAWHEAAALIPQSELDAISAQYGHLEGNSDQLIGEWFARQVEKLNPGELPDPQSAFGKLWQAIKDWLARITGNSTDLDQRVRDLARDIIKRPESLEGRQGLEGDVESSIPQPALKFQDTTKPKRPGWLNRLNPVANRKRLADVESLRQEFNIHGGEINAGNMAFDALQREREKQGSSLDHTKFEKDSLLGAAIHVYRQVKGDQQILTDQRDQLKAKGGEQYVPAWDKAMTLTAAEKAMADKVTQDYKENALTAQSAGLSIPVDEAYGKQVWDLKNNRGRAGFGDFLSRFESDPSSFKKKKHPTSFDGIMSGLTPKTLDDFKLVSVNGKEVNRAVATRKLAQRLPELRDSSGKPLVIIDGDQSIHMNDHAVVRLQALAASGVAIPVQMRQYSPSQRYAVGGNPVANFDPTGFKAAGGRGVQGYYYQLPAAGGGMKNYYGKLLFSPEAFPYADSRTSPSWWRETAAKPHIGGKIVTGVFTLNREIKASLLGALSAFHYVQEGFHGIGHATNPLWNLPPVDPLNPEHLQWMKSGLMLGGEHDAIKYFEGGGDLEALFYKIPVLGFLSRKMSEHLFTRYIPALKLKTAQNAYKRNQQRFSKQLANGSMSDAEVRHITATAVNDAYGHINWADLGIGKSMRDFLQVAALAPDFLLARSRFAAQALGVQRARGVDTSKAGREAFMAFFVLAAFQWMTARLSNWILNDGDMRTDIKDLFAVVNKKTGERMSLRTVPGDVLEAVEKPVEFFNNRASPLVRDLYNIVMGTNWRQEKVGHGAALTDALVGALPITAQPLVRDYTTTGQQSPTSKAEDFVRSLGVKINRYSQLGEVKSKAHEYMSTHGDKTGTDFHQPSVYNPILFHLLDKDEAGAAKELDKLMAGDRRQLERVVKGFHASLFRSYAGDAPHDVNFRRELSQTQEGKQLLHDADRQRMEAWQLFLKVGKVPYDIRGKFKERIAEPSDATLAKARELRLKQTS